MTGFVAIYRWRVAPENEEAFEIRWTEATLALSKLGGMGSLLGKSGEGIFCAVALWPSRKARDQAFKALADEKPWPAAERLEPILIDPIADHWDNSPFD